MRTLFFIFPFHTYGTYERGKDAVIEFMNSNSRNSLWIKTHNWVGRIINCEQYIDSDWRGLSWGGEVDHLEWVLSLSCWVDHLEWVLILSWGGVDHLEWVLSLSCWVEWIILSRFSLYHVELSVSPWVGSLFIMLSWVDSFFVMLSWVEVDHLEWVVSAIHVGLRWSRSLMWAITQVIFIKLRYRKKLNCSSTYCWKVF